MAELLTFRDTLLKIVPPWLLGFTGTRLLYSLGVHLDAAVELAVQGVRARFPTAEVPGQLPRIGRDRAMRRGLLESNKTYARRLERWLDVHRSATNPYGLMDVLAAMLAPHTMRMRIVNDSGEWYTRNADASREFVSVPGSWNWDGLGPTTRFWVIIYPPAALWTREGVWSDPGTVGDGGTIGSTASPEYVEVIRNVVHDCRAAHTYCHDIILAFSSSAFNPTGTVEPDGQWNLWSHRSPNYAYWQGA